jgi:Integrase core domain
MITLLFHLLRLLPVLCGSHRHLALENLALRQQLAVYRKTLRRPKLHPSDRLFWVFLSPVWAGCQQIVDTFRDDTAPSYLLRDRDAIYGEAFRQRVKGMQIREVLTAARSPWQNPFERLIGSIRRDCLDHVIVMSARHLRHVLTGYFAYYHRTRTHLSLTKDAPDRRPVEPPELGKVVPIREVGGLHHRYVRRAA